MDEFPPDLPPEAPPPPPPFTAPPAPPGHESGLPPLPFENRAVPWLNGLLETIGLFIRKPDEAFSRMNVTGDLLRPVLYAIIVGSAGYILSSVWQIAFGPMMQRWMPGGAEYESALQSRAFWFGFAACSPLLVVVHLVVATLVIHLCVMVLGGAKRGLGATLRVLCYALTATLAGVIPICGSIVSTFWYLYLLIIGLAKAHGITPGKAAVAILVPALLCCVCIAILMFSAFGALMSSGALPGMH
jgi:hypothetical protein